MVWGGWVGGGGGGGGGAREGDLQGGGGGGGGVRGQGCFERAAGLGWQGLGKSLMVLGERMRKGVLLGRWRRAVSAGEKAGSTAMMAGWTVWMVAVMECMMRMNSGP